MSTQDQNIERQAHPAFARRPSENFAHTGLRGLAALAVVGFHAMRHPEPLEPGLGSFLQASYLFVDLFFVLSGFIMFETYAPRLRTGAFRKEALRFLFKRALKILPNYYIWLLCGAGFLR